MKLFYRNFGAGQPLIILHGLFGQSDNWNSLAKQFADTGFEVYIVDQRNHGLSPHSEVWNYEAMSDDILELINDNNLQQVILLGHSMGGKTAMQFAVTHPQLLDKLIVVDITLKYYPPHHQHILKTLNAVDFKIVKTRKEVAAILLAGIPDAGTNQFLLKNIYWKENGELAWRFNLTVISKQIENASEAIQTTNSCDVPTLIIRGELSDYVLDTDIALMKEVFPRNMLETIKGAGHWVHAEKPEAFFECVRSFIK